MREGEQGRKEWGDDKRSTDCDQRWRDLKCIFLSAFSVMRQSDWIEETYMKGIHYMA